MKAHNREREVIALKQESEARIEPLEKECKKTEAETPLLIIIFCHTPIINSERGTDRCESCSIST
jgi:hypothetical protein